MQLFTQLGYTLNSLLYHTYIHTYYSYSSFIIPDGFQDGRRRVYMDSKI